ncbi:uncharacterized protein LOC129585069 [Paramacrobiotus metropolitanus]|uniref:uncharacterized protein LOC129585069 n=1 Tax=Paramacrobiotus metropolitanus TaxID=2943436 RepID=UPI002445F4D6|nr:uncharacterized protein LOC129585069 [Paramacrobiotus metropolitanus]
MVLCVSITFAVISIIIHIRKECHAQPWMPMPPFFRPAYQQDDTDELDNFYQPAMYKTNTVPSTGSYDGEDEAPGLDIQIDASAASTVVPHYAKMRSRYIPSIAGGAILTDSIPESAKSTKKNFAWSSDHDLIADGSTYRQRQPPAHEYPLPFLSNDLQYGKSRAPDSEIADRVMSINKRRRISTGREGHPGFVSTHEFNPEQQSSIRDYVVNMGQRLNGGWRAYPTNKMYYSPMNDNNNNNNNMNNFNDAPNDQVMVPSQPPRFAMSNMFDPVGTPYDGTGFMRENSQMQPWSPPPPRRMDYEEQFYAPPQPPPPNNFPNEMDGPPFDPSNQFPFQPPMQRPRFPPRHGGGFARRPGQPLRVLEPAVPPSDFNRRFPIRDTFRSGPRRRPQRVKAAEEEQFEPGYGPVSRLRQWLYETSKLAGSSHGGGNTTVAGSDTAASSEPGYGPPPSTTDAGQRVPPNNAGTARKKRTVLRRIPA